MPDLESAFELAIEPHDGPAWFVHPELPLAEPPHPELPSDPPYPELPNTWPPYPGMFPELSFEPSFEPGGDPNRQAIAPPAAPPDTHPGPDVEPERQETLPLVACQEPQLASDVELGVPAPEAGGESSPQEMLGPMTCPDCNRPFNTAAHYTMHRQRPCWTTLCPNRTCHQQLTWAVIQQTPNGRRQPTPTRRRNGCRRGRRNDGGVCVVLCPEPGCSRRCQSTELLMRHHDRDHCPKECPRPGCGELVAGTASLRLHERSHLAREETSACRPGLIPCHEFPV